MNNNLPRKGCRGWPITHQRKLVVGWGFTLVELLLVAASIGLLAMACSASAASWYVATNGSDSAAGTLAAPFQTLSNAYSKASAGDTIQVRGGTYREAVVLAGKSGSAGSPITLTSYTNETAVLSGLDVQNLTWTTNSGISNVWVATYTGGAFEQMFVDGKPMLEARWPNVPLDTNGNWNFFSSNCWATVDSSGNSYGTISDAQLAATGWNITGWRAVLNVNHQYYTWTRIATNHAAGSSTFNYPTNLGSSIDPNQSYNDDRYYLVGNTNLLDSPGEWCYDANRQLLYFYPFNGKNPNTSIVEIKTRNFAFTADKNSSYLTVAGLTFWGTAFQFGTGVGAKSSNIVLKNNSVLYSSSTDWLNLPNGDPHAANDGNYPQLYADSCQVINNSFACGALSALSIIGWTNLIENNVIHDFDLSSSLVYPPLDVGNAILYNIGKYGNATVRYNSIYNSGGILAQIVGTNTQAYLNDLHDAFRACWGGNKDTAALYNTTQAGVTNNLNIRFHHNWVHAGYSGAANPPWGGGLGIRGDDNTVGLTVDHNVTWDLGGAGIQIKNVTNPIPAQVNACINNTVFNYSVLYSATNGAIYIQQPVTGTSNNVLSSVANNLADSIYGDWGAVPLGPLALNAGNSVGLGTETNLENIGWSDFRPQAGAANVLNRGVVFSSTTTNWVGSAPDIGAYERGDSLYFIPGQRATNATFPIVPNGAVVTTNRDVLMWRPAYNVASSKVYFGAASGALTNAATYGGETNVYPLPSLTAGQTYYWRVDAVMTNGAVVTGDVWTFATLANPMIWDGGSAVDSYWTTATNWNPNVIPVTNGTEVLTFAGTKRNIATNNFAANTPFAGINFSNTVAGQAFTLNGNPIALGGNIVTTSAAGTITDTNALSLMLTADCTVAANPNHHLLISGTINDDGGGRSLIKTGSATLTLSATNSFTGTVIISNGILAASSIGNGVNSAVGYSTAAIQLGGGGSLYYNGSGQTVARAITLTGSSGNCIFGGNGTGALIYAGQLTGNGAATPFQFSGGSAMSVTNDFQTSIPNTISNVALVGYNFWKISGPIHSVGSVNVQWSGSLLLANDASDFPGGSACYGGGTLAFTSIGNVNGGSSAMGNPSTSSAGVILLGYGTSGSGDGTLNYVGIAPGGHTTDRHIKIGNTPAATGNARINANGVGPLIWSDPNAFLLSQTGYTNNHTLTLGGTNLLANEIKGPIIDQTAGAGQTSLLKTDGGIWILSGSNTYTGPTTVSNGTLLINGNASAATNTWLVVSNATLGGLGRIGGVVNFQSGAFALFTVDPTAANGYSNSTYLTFTNAVFLTNVTVAVSLPSALGNGTYVLATNFVGFTTNGSLTYVAHGGALGSGGSGRVSVAGQNLVLTISGVTNASAGPVQPAFASVTLSGTSLTLTASNGTPNSVWTLLQSTNLTVPASQWRTNRTGTYNASGWLITNFVRPTTDPIEFFILK